MTTGAIASHSPKARCCMQRLLRWGALPWLLLLPLDAALACGGGPDTGPVWTLDHRQYAGDNGLPFLSPGNDSRINLQFLMLDAASRRPAPLKARRRYHARADHYGALRQNRSRHGLRTCAATRQRAGR